MAEATPVVNADTSLLGGAAAATPLVDANAAKPAADPAGAKPAGADDKGKPAGQEKPPAEVKYELKVPDGIDLKDQLPKFTEVAKELKVSPEQAQKLLDWYVSTNQEKLSSMETEWKATNDGWIKTAQADKEIGGDAFKTNIDAAKGAISKFGNKEFIDALNMTGMGNHPEMIRFLTKVAAGFKEDNLQGGGTPIGDKPKTAADLLFPKK